MFLAGHTVALVTYCDTKMITMCSPMVGQFLDTMIVASSDKQWITKTGNCLAHVLRSLSLTLKTEGLTL